MTGPRSFDPKVLDELVTLGPGLSELLRAVTPRWMSDQLDAAGAEATDLGRLVGESGVLPRQHDVPATDRRMMRLFYALMRHTRTWCPHARAGPVAVVAVIDAGWVGCRRCLAQHGPALLDDDPRCRLCDRVTATYRPMAVTVGPIMYFAEVCESCHRELVEEP